MSENNNSNRDSGNKRRRRRPNKNGQGNSQGNSGNKNSNSSRNNNRRRNNRNRGNNRRGPKLTGVELTLHKYQNLLEQYLTSRRKYFELFERADPNQKAKLERNYFTNCQKLREFETSLSPEEKAEFNLRNHEASPDTIYSQNNNLPAQAEPVPLEGEFEDAHLLVSQKSSNYSHDTEESVGTMEDYEAYRAELSN